ncbi:MAG: glycine cleavage system aminomethyltransferase GcvT [Deltaproteobacteria bacterium]|nr:glycine cleavage system aminomethyltransferase GcvT [Deltaproteobacteria bacterium]
MHEYVPSQELKQFDPLLYDIVHHESERQRRKIILIASESICPPVVREALACEFSNIYAEGYPSPRTLFEPPHRLWSFQHQLTHFRRYSNRRYYKGCEYVDILEQTARRRTAEVFATETVSADEIFVNVQPLSGAAANNAVYNAFVEPGGTVMGGGPNDGGHLTHGTPANRSGKTFKSVPYGVSRSGKLDYAAIEKLAVEHRPQLLIGGFSAYPWDVDWARMRAIADRAGAVLLADIAHLAGMVAAGLLANPIGHAHAVSFTTHKTLCGPRGAMLLSTDPEIAAKLDAGVFPGEQGGPHIHMIAAKAVAMKMAASPAFRELQRKVLENARTLAEAFQAEGLALAYGGTNTHMCLLDLKKLETPNGLPLSGEIASRILDLCGITCNKNTISGDTSPIHPSGLRFGTTWATQRGFGPEHMRKLAKITARALRAIHPFAYIGAKLAWGRGKIDPAVMEQVASEVEALLDEADSTLGPEDRTSVYPHYQSPAQQGPRSTALSALHKSQAIKLLERGGWKVPAGFGEHDKEVRALREGAGLVDAGNALLLELGKGRSGQLLEGACTARVLGLEERQSTAALLLDPRGRPMAKAIVLRLPADDHGYDRHLVKLSATDPDRALRWLRGLSDGYLLHDEDLWAKCEGPAVVDDLARPSGGLEPVACLGLRGPGSQDVIAEAFGARVPERGRAIEHEGSWILHRPEHSQAGFDLFVPSSKAASIWSRLMEAGAQPVGCTALDEVLATPALTAESDPLAEPLAGRVALDKPFFIGQKALRAKREPAEDEGKPVFRFEPVEGELRKTCLHAEHEKRTREKQMVPFAGWEMPVTYGSILAEHEAVRRRVGLFDVSHMGVLDFKGPFAGRFLDLLTTNYVPMLVDSQAQYSYLLDCDGRCIDDIIIYKLAREHYMVIVNAANADEDEAWIRAAAEDGVRLDAKRPDVSARGGGLAIRNLKDAEASGEDARVDLALQGPRALELMLKIAAERDRTRLAHLRKFFICRAELAGIDCLVGRTGYTGAEIGFELYLHPDRAVEMWNALLEAGEEHGIAPCGLGARDSLRIEAGYPLHGHELAGPHRISPIEAGYGSFVMLHKPFFVGREACMQGAEKRERTIVRFEVDEKSGKMLRPGMPVLEGRKGEYSGVVTSCTYTGERQVGLALIRSEHAKEGGKLQILPVTEHDRKQPPAVTPLGLERGDWMSVPRQATVLSRFLDAGAELGGEGDG